MLPLNHTQVKKYATNVKKNFKTKKENFAKQKIIFALKSTGVQLVTVLI